MKTLIVGIASYEQIKMRTIAIASGKYKPTEDEPKVWFTSLESFENFIYENKILNAVHIIIKPFKECFSS